MGIPIKALFSAFLFIITLAFYSPAFGQDVPEDFEVVFTSSPALPSQAVDIETLTISESGEAILSPVARYVGQFPDYARQELPELAIQLSPEAMAEIFGAINSNEFFSLAANYSDPEIMDGDWAELTVTSNGQTHTVRTRNIKVMAFDRITVTINGQLPEERRLKYNAINGAYYVEVER